MFGIKQGGGGNKINTNFIIVEPLGGEDAIWERDTQIETTLLAIFFSWG